MGASRRLCLFASLTLVFVCAARASAAEPDAPHIRPLSADIVKFVAEGQRRSQTIRALVARLEQSDLIVYIRARQFTSPLTTGHMQFVGATPGRRYVMIEIACGESWNIQLATLGHELRHAVELGEVPWVRSAEDVEAHYARIGFVSGFDSGHNAFETNAAADAGRQVARELLGDGGAPVAIVTRNGR
jgi:hypothetical protein